MDFQWLSQTSLFQLYEVLLALFFWLSVLTGLLAFTVLVVLGVNVHGLMKRPVHARRTLLPGILLSVLLVRELFAGQPTVPLGLGLYIPTPEGRAPTADKVSLGGPSPVEGGQPRRLGLAMEGLMDPRMHPDGKRITFSGGKQAAEVWVVENFLPAVQSER